MFEEECVPSISSDLVSGASSPASAIVPGIFLSFFLSHEFAKSLQGNVRKPSRKGKMQYALMKTRKELS